MEEEVQQPQPVKKTGLFDGDDDYGEEGESQ